MPLSLPKCLHPLFHLQRRSWPFAPFVVTAPSAAAAGLSARLAVAARRTDCEVAAQALDI
jgi:hypothetical protein